MIWKSFDESWCGLKSPTMHDGGLDLIGWLDDKPVARIEQFVNRPDCFYLNDIRGRVPMIASLAEAKSLAEQRCAPKLKVVR